MSPSFYTRVPEHDLTVYVRPRQPYLQPAQPLNLADLPLEPAGQAFESAFDSQRSVGTDPAGRYPGRTSYDTKQASRLRSCAEFHDGPPSFILFCFARK